MLAHLDLTLLVALKIVTLSLGQKPPQKNLPAATNIVDLESKDVVLQMLEKKLKEIKDNKRQRNGNGDVLPKNVDISLKSNGISAVGDTELLLRYGKTGQGTLNLTADGMSNVGRVQLVVGTGEVGLNIPGLSNLFAAPSIRSEYKNSPNQPPIDDVNFGFRRQTNVSNTSNTVDKVSNPADKASNPAEKPSNNNPATDIVQTKTDDITKAETSSSVTTGKTEGTNPVSGAAVDTSTANVNTSASSQVVPESNSKQLLV